MRIFGKGNVGNTILHFERFGFLILPGKYQRHLCMIVKGHVFGTEFTGTFRNRTFSECGSAP